MDGESEPRLRSYSSTCIANKYSEKITTERQTTSYNNREIPHNLHVLSKQQEIKFCEECRSSNGPFCHVKLESVEKLKESTKQLLCLLEEIQSKTRGKNNIPVETCTFTNYLKALPQVDVKIGNKEIFDSNALKKLEDNAKNIDVIYIEDEHENCSIYKRLTRKCHCLNRPEYNDFVIHFNEDSKYTTSHLGEIIKNMRILRKFLYIGSSYTKNALMFLNEGLTDSSHSERVEVTQACAYADICSVFDERSIVVLCVSWPCRNKHQGDYMTQALAAGVLYKLAQLEEGRRYLNYNSKITNDIKKVLRKQNNSLEIDTIQSLNATLNLLHPVFTKNVAMTCFKKSIYEDVGKRAICDLVQRRQYMTFNEVLIHLDVLDTYCQCNSGRVELTSHLPLVLMLFKRLLLEYDNSELNITVTNILNSIISRYMVEEKKTDSVMKTMAETATQAINIMANVECQFPQQKAKTKKINKSKIIRLSVAPHKRSMGQVSEWESRNSIRKINRSKKFNKGLTVVRKDQ